MSGRQSVLRPHKQMERLLRHLCCFLLLQAVSPPSRAEIREGAERALQHHLQQQRHADSAMQRQHSRRPSGSMQPLPPESMLETYAAADAPAAPGTAARRPTAAQPRTSDRQWGAHPMQAAARPATAGAAGARQQHPQQPPQQQPRPQQPSLSGAEGGDEDRGGGGWVAWAGCVGGLRTGWV